jgi:hypothetical protein
MARIGIQILAADYLRFKALLPNEERLGKNYSEWVKRRADEDSLYPEGVTNVTVLPEDFRLYCLQISQRPSYSVLEAFAVSKSREPK